MAAAIDQAECIAGDRVGGPKPADLTAVRRHEAALPPPSTADDWRWLAQRLARAVINGWTPRTAARLLALADTGEAD